MNSSTFSSRDEWKVLLVVAVVLTACELGVRGKVGHHADDQHITQIPQLARRLRAEPQPQVLFLGNSLTKRGVNIDTFESTLAHQGLHVGACATIHPDDTTIQHWHYVFERHFSGPANEFSPECIVFTFCLDHLSDQVEPRNRRLAKLVGGPAQVTEVLLTDLTSIDQRAGFLMANFFRAVSDQSEIKTGVLNRVIPHYSAEMQRLNSLRRAYGIAKASQEEAPPAPISTYHRLERLMSLLRQNDSRGVFCLMPLPSEQSLDPKLVEAIESSGMVFLDLRDLASLTKGHYPDGYHMDAVAANIYSRALANVLAERHPELFVGADQTHSHNPSTHSADPSLSQPSS